MKITKKQFSVIVFILLVLIILFKEHYTDVYYPDKECENCNPEDVDKLLKDIVISKQKKLTNKMIESCKDGLLRGCVAGSLTGGVPGAIAGGLVYGITNPIVTYINEEQTKK